MTVQQVVVNRPSSLVLLGSEPDTRCSPRRSWTRSSGVATPRLGWTNGSIRDAHLTLWLRLGLELLYRAPEIGVVSRKSLFPHASFRHPQPQEKGFGFGSNSDVRCPRLGTSREGMGAQSHPLGTRGFQSGGWWKTPYARGHRCVRRISRGLGSRRDPWNAPVLAAEQAAAADRLVPTRRPIVEAEVTWPGRPAAVTRPPPRP